MNFNAFEFLSDYADTEVRRRSSSEEKFFLLFSG